MREFTWVSGQLTEVQRFINVPMRWCEQYPARERRELWVTTTEGEDFKFVVHTRVMPARRGHRVVAVLLGGRLVGLHNLSTGEGVNFYRTDPPLLFRQSDGAVVTVLIAAVVGACCAGLAFAGFAVAILALSYLPIAAVWRLVARSAQARAIESAIGSARRQATGASHLKRVK